MRNDTLKVLLFVLTMTTIVALTLAGLFYSTADRVKKNEEVYNKRAILSAVKSELGKPLDDITNDELLDIFKNQVTQSVVDGEGNTLELDEIKALGYGGTSAESIDMAKEKKKPVEDRVWPIYEYTSQTKEKFYIIVLRGNGLWDEIWGYVALEADAQTIAGVAFDHKAETPGLGAEIKDSKAFQEQFKGTSLWKNDEYQGILVQKAGAKDEKYEVDGITGATITADGVTDMFEVGVKSYAPYLASLTETN